MFVFYVVIVFVASNDPGQDWLRSPRQHYNTLNLTTSLMLIAA